MRAAVPSTFRRRSEDHRRLHHAVSDDRLTEMDAHVQRVAWQGRIRYRRIQLVDNKSSAASYQPPTEQAFPEKPT